MKIIERGIKPPKYMWIGRYHCVYCKSVIDLTEEDAAAVIDWHDDQRDGMSAQIVCPVCEVTRWLSREGG